MSWSGGESAMFRLRPLRFDTQHTLSDLLHMDHWAELKTDCRQTYRLWTRHTWHAFTDVARASGRCFKFTAENNHAMVVSLFLLSGFLLAHLYGQIAYGWSQTNPIVLTAAGAWAFLFGRLFQIEFRVTVPGFQLTNDTDDDSED